MAKNLTTINLSQKTIEQINGCPLLQILCSNQLLFYDDELKGRQGLSSRKAYDALIKQIMERYNIEEFNDSIPEHQEFLQKYVIEEAVKEISESFDDLSEMQKSFIMAVTQELVKTQLSESEQKFQGIYFEAVPEIKRGRRADYYYFGPNILKVSFSTVPVGKKDQIKFLKEVLKKLDSMLKMGELTEEEGQQIKDILVTKFEVTNYDELLNLKSFKNLPKRDINDILGYFLEQVSEEIRRKYGDNFLKKFNPFKIYKKMVIIYFLSPPLTHRLLY